MPKTRNKVEFGDFQTPSELAYKVCRLLKEGNLHPASLIEPTCGCGNFVFAALESYPSIKEGLALDINPAYTQIVSGRIGPYKRGMEIKTGDFFQFKWSEYIHRLPEPILIIGNPPWVTNAQIGSMSGSNLPPKSNFYKLKGFDAQTGKSNFDISEWMLIKLFEFLNGRNATIAMLCKVSVARKVLDYAWKNGFGLGKSALYEINAKQDFNAAVEACLLISDFRPGGDNKECLWYSSLTEISAPKRVIGIRDGRLVSDVELYAKWRHLVAKTEQEYMWRTGIKHDCSKVMELRWLGGSMYRNGLDEEIELESDCLYPLVKSSDLFNEREPSRWLIVTQRKIGDNTEPLKKMAPKTWNYLFSHRVFFEKRTSVIYKDMPPFSIFGVGDYSFSPWKVAVSGFYKEPRFRLIGTHAGKPVIPDDTVNFIPCGNAGEAKKLVEIFNSDPVVNFFKAVTFIDAKRPFTVGLLSQLDIEKLMGKERHQPLLPLFYE